MLWKLIQQELGKARFRLISRKRWVNLFRRKETNSVLLLVVQGNAVGLICSRWVTRTNWIIFHRLIFPSLIFFQSSMRLNWALVIEWKGKKSITFLQRSMKWSKLRLIMKFSKGFYLKNTKKNKNFFFFFWKNWRWKKDIS